ncbi:MAG TPA: type VI secretion system baseplate subunit TssF [Acidobacteriota bacterium]|nr:type VI secretion system baseplate subunit TssF [Acidobacteriota bacterium]
MINDYCQEELQNLRELAVEFAKAHPALAPMLSGPSTDPDVERLLEGVAFLTGLLRGKLDDDFPEIVHSLMELIFPHLLRPVPASTVVAFSPKPGLQESVIVKAGTSLAGVPIDGVTCLFRTCFHVEAHPLKITAAELRQSPGQPDRIRIACELTGPTLDQWRPTRLGFFLGDSLSLAMDLFLLLSRYIRRITVAPAAGGMPTELPPGSLHAVGFDLDNALLAFPRQAFRGYRLLQEYFILPEKFLFFELQGWDAWRDRGKGNAFELLFELMPAPVAPPRVKADSFVLNATPVINLFRQEAEPVQLDHRTEKVRIRPATKQPGCYQVYSVDTVAGYRQGSVTRRDYRPLEAFSAQTGGAAVYQVIRARSPIDGTPETMLSFAYSSDPADLVSETLSITLTCTNGTLPERLQLGDICKPTEDSPELLTYRNILPLTPAVEPVLGKNALWRLLAHLSLNFMALADSTGLKEMLRQYIPAGRDRARVSANIKQVDGVADFTVTPSDRLFRGQVMRGQQVALTVRQDHYTGLGGMFLFGSVLELFMGVYCSMNSYSQFQIKDTLSGETFSWPPRIGDRQLS